MPFTRSSGVLLHPTSLPGPGGIGELGDHAYRWVDFLVDGGQSLWQVMPLGPTGYGDSPYQSFSSFAGNPLLISLERLHQDGWLTRADLDDLDLREDRVDYGPVITGRVDRLGRAARAFDARAGGAQRDAFDAFCAREAAWLDDFALFMALKERHGGRAWNEWEPALRDRDGAALAAVAAQSAEVLRRHKLWQHWFHQQWSALRSYANTLGVKVVGDVPIFVAYDSADTWANRELFHLDAAGAPTVVAGVPPDYFSATGQRWGNPLYRWKRMAATGFDWWIRRFRTTLDFVDLVRVDHFRGFAGYWEIPAAEPTAVKGRWVKGPGQPFFDALEAALGELPILAEDLGVITPDVEALRDDNALPGMKVLQFAFAGGADDPYLPHNYTSNALVYTGTHDNDTTVGWYAQAPEEERDLVRRYLARGDETVAWELWRAASASVADLAIAPLQDLLGLGSEARMNTPGVASGNWSWRFRWPDIPDWLAGELRDMAEVYGRVASAGAVDTAYRQSVTEAAPVEESDEA
jgi:4-alpha-glucanotransferase